MSGIARVTACALWGLETELVTVEVDVSSGLPGFDVVGLPDSAVREARERVRAAIRNSGFEFPLRRITVNLAPAERRKEGTGFDLAIALAILRASGQLLVAVSELCVGELGLDGAVRPVRGVLPRARRAVGAGIPGALVAGQNAAEAAAAGSEAIAVDTLRAAVCHLEGTVRLAPAARPPLPDAPAWEVDLGDIVGQETPKRALEIAAAGGHNLLLIGPPGTGKTLLAQALPSILPPLDEDEAMAASVVHSVAGLVDPGRPLLRARPFRAPHHTASRLSLVGGGTPPRPGEVSLAHTGALFLDELAQFSPQVLDTLREPLQEGRITISRAGTSATYPARFTLIAAMNPCPCGKLGDSATPCTCLPDAIDRYNGRISGPLLDRLNLRVHVPRVPYEALRDGRAHERSSDVRRRVLTARARMTARGCRANSELTPAELRRHCSLDGPAEELLGRAVQDRRLSARAYHRILRVARTMADLEESDGVRRDHLASALLLRA